MDYLTLCQTARRRAGMSGAGPAQVTGNTGEMARLVDWIQQAWLDLQAHRDRWQPQWREFSVPVSVGQTSVTVPDLGDLVTERLRYAGRPLTWYEWGEMPARETEAEYPSGISQRPDGMLVFFPKPTAAGDLTGEHYLAPQVLTNDSDEPWLPRHLQDAIIYQALIYYAAYEDAPEIYNDATRKVMLYQVTMVNELLPQMDIIGGTLA